MTETTYLDKIELSYGNGDPCVRVFTNTERFQEVNGEIVLTYKSVRFEQYHRGNDYSAEPEKIRHVIDAFWEKFDL